MRNLDGLDVLRFIDAAAEIMELGEFPVGDEEDETANDEWKEICERDRFVRGE